MVARVTRPQPREMALVATVSEAFELRFKTSGWLAASSPTSTHPPWHLWSDSPDIKPPNPSTRTTTCPASPLQPRSWERWEKAWARYLLCPPASGEFHLCGWECQPGHSDVVQGDRFLGGRMGSMGSFPLRASSSHSKDTEVEFIASQRFFSCPQHRAHRRSPTFLSRGVQCLEPCLWSPPQPWVDTKALTVWRQ